MHREPGTSCSPNKPWEVAGMRPQDIRKCTLIPVIIAWAASEKYLSHRLYAFLVSEAN